LKRDPGATEGREEERVEPWRQRTKGGEGKRDLVPKSWDGERQAGAVQHKRPSAQLQRTQRDARAPCRPLGDSQTASATSQPRQPGLVSCSEPRPACLALSCGAGPAPAFSVGPPDRKAPRSPALRKPAATAFGRQRQHAAVAFPSPQAGQRFCVWQRHGSVARQGVTAASVAQALVCGRRQGEEASFWFRCGDQKRRPALLFGLWHGMLC
jgi:hypothetical protein